MTVSSATQQLFTVRVAWGWEKHHLEDWRKHCPAFPQGGETTLPSTEPRDLRICTSGRVSWAEDLEKFALVETNESYTREYSESAQKVVCYNQKDDPDTLMHSRSKLETIHGNAKIFMCNPEITRHVKGMCRNVVHYAENSHSIKTNAGLIELAEDSPTTAVFHMWKKLSQTIEDIQWTKIKLLWDQQCLQWKKKTLDGG